MRELGDSCLVDPNCHENGFYSVESLYLDSEDLSMFYDKVDGFRNRLKLRIRSYNGNHRHYRLEIKMKSKYHTSKNVEEVNFDENHGLITWPEFKRRISNTEFMKLTQLKSAQPSIWIRYDRSAFIPKGHGNFRLTIDRNIACSTATTMPPRENTYIRLNNETTVFEVKYNDYLPAWLKMRMNELSTFQRSISKYHMSTSQAYELEHQR